MPPSIGASPWSLDPKAGRLELAGLRATFDAEDPSRGLRELRFDGAELSGVTFGVGVGKGGEALEPPEEVYVRGSDLLSVHPARDGWPFRTQLRWSAQPLDSVEGALVALTVSLQTDLLDTRPDLRIRFTPGEAATIEDGPAGQRRLQWEPAADGSPRLVVAPYPTDLPEASMLATRGSCSVLLAPPFLEKGVIRRCRVGLLALAAGADPDGATTRGLEEFAGIAVPLTA